MSDERDERGGISERLDALEEWKVAQTEAHHKLCAFMSEFCEKQDGEMARLKEIVELVAIAGEVLSRVQSPQPPEPDSAE